MHPYGSSVATELIRQTLHANQCTLTHQTIDTSRYLAGRDNEVKKEPTVAFVLIMGCGGSKKAQPSEFDDTLDKIKEGKKTHKSNRALKHFDVKVWQLERKKRRFRVSFTELLSSLTP